MAKLNRRDDGGIYTRINIGGIATKQIHPDAVRYLNKRNVYVGDDIPSELMRTLRNKRGWLYTKEEYPFVVFAEYSDRSFGERPRSSNMKKSSKHAQSKATTFAEVQTKPKPKKRQRARRDPAPAFNYSVQGGIESKQVSKLRNDQFEQQRVQKFREEQAAAKHNVVHSQQWSEPFFIDQVIPAQDSANIGVVGGQLPVFDVSDSNSPGGSDPFIRVDVSMPASDCSPYPACRIEMRADDEVATQDLQTLRDTTVRAPVNKGLGRGPSQSVVADQSSNFLPALVASAAPSLQSEQKTPNNENVLNVPKEEPYNRQLAKHWTMVGLLVFIVLLIVINELQGA